MINADGLRKCERKGSTGWRWSALSPLSESGPPLSLQALLTMSDRKPSGISLGKTGLLDSETKLSWERRQLQDARTSRAQPLFPAPLWGHLHPLPPLSSSQSALSQLHCFQAKLLPPAAIKRIPDIPVQGHSQPGRGGHGQSRQLPLRPLVRAEGGAREVGRVGGRLFAAGEVASRTTACPMPAMDYSRGSRRGG